MVTLYQIAVNQPNINIGSTEHWMQRMPQLTVKTTLTVSLFLKMLQASSKSSGESLRKLL